MTTIKQIADKYGVSKSTARRWVMACFPDIDSGGSTIDLDANQVQVVAGYADSRGAVRVNQDEPSLNCGESVRSGSGDAILARFEAENEALLNRCASLEREVERLHEELGRMHAALEREQMQARGFWSRLGQKLLGSGK